MEKIGKETSTDEGRTETKKFGHRNNHRISDSPNFRFTELARF